MLPTQKSPPKTTLTDLTVLIYGPSKIGKSTWCSQADGALFLATEAGLNNLDVYYCQSLVDLDITGCTNLRYIYAYGCAFDEAMVDQLLVDLAANGVTNGYLRINGGSNSPPSDPDGLALKAILIDRGWNIYHN